VAKDAIPMNVIDVEHILAVERERDAIFKVITENRTWSFKTSSMVCRGVW